MAARPPIPTVVDVGPFRYRISVDEIDRLRMEEAQQELVSGATDHDKLLIVVDDRLPAGMIRDTVLHEILHTVTNITGLAYEWRDKDKEETTVRRMSPVLLDMLRRNPDVVAYLLDEA